MDAQRFNAGTPPYEAAGKRWLLSNSVPGNLLHGYFNGPGYTEKYTYGWIAIYSGATGHGKLDISSGIARVYPADQCNGRGVTYTMANLWRIYLQQFNYIQFVKIYDQNGNTEIPEGNQDLTPACLEP